MLPLCSKKAAFQITTQRKENIGWFSDEVSLWDTFSLQPFIKHHQSWKHSGIPDISAA